MTEDLYECDCYMEYGIVRIINGDFKGCFVYYDDDDMDDDGEEKAVVYFGDIIHNSKCLYIPHEYITNNYSVKDLKERQDEIIRTLWKNISDFERALLAEEMNLINLELFSQYETFIDSKKLNKVKVFLSHSSLDKNIVVPLALDLEKRGVSTWLDAFDILPGESIVSKIDEGLSECDFVLLFMSKNSVNSSWVKKEWETMLMDEISNGKIKIIPIKLEDCEIPKILKSKKYIDLSRDYHVGLFEIVNAINKYN